MIRIEQLSFGFGKQALFSQLDLELAPGGIYGLLGLNGAGKTSLLKLLAGLRFPWSGSVRVGEHEPRERAVEFLADLAFVPEVCYVPNQTIGSFVDSYAPFYPRFEHERYAGYLAEFGLKPEQNLSKLSHGQEKKATLAFALSCGARLLLLDEPSNGLDIPSKSQLRQVLAGAVREDRVIVISTHQVRDLEALIDPVVILHEGRIIFNHSLAQIAKRLAYRTLDADPTGAADVLYAEPQLGVWHAVCRRGADAEAPPPELELLFKAAIRAPQALVQLFREEA
jgi:ABC-2 type transport system ATP-binding protein